MKRRSFLAMLGLAPVVAVPAVKAAVTETPQIRIEAVPSDYPLIDYPKRATSAYIEDYQKWLSEGVLAFERRLDDHTLWVADQ